MALDFWKNITIGDIWPFGRKIICFQGDDSVADCLRILEKKTILSAPVLDSNNKLIGIVDTQQILTFLLGIYPKSIESIQTLTGEGFNEIIQKGKVFSNTPIKEVIEVHRKFDQSLEDIFPVTLETPIEKLVDMFYLGVHRVPVIGNDGTVINVISQSDFLQVVAQSLPVLGDLNDKTLEELELTAEKTIYSIKENQSVLVALSILNRHKVSALPVISESGKLVANFSASNLKDTNVYNFAELLVGVKEFLELQNLRPAPFFVKLSHKKALHPVAFKKATTFHSVVTEMTALRVHRVWITDEEERICGVISLGDLFQVFLPWGAPNKSKIQ